MPFVPVLYRLKVKPDPVEEKTSGGIIITAQTKDREQTATVTGTVVNVGPSAFEGNHVVSVGDRVLFAKYGGLIHREDGIEYRFMNDDDLVAIEREA